MTDHTIETTRARVIRSTCSAFTVHLVQWSIRVWAPGTGDTAAARERCAVSIDVHAMSQLMRRSSHTRPKIELIRIDDCSPALSSVRTALRKIVRMLSELDNNHVMTFITNDMLDIKASACGPQES